MSITIKSTIEGFRRAGVAHSKEPTTYPDDTFTEAQLAQLKAEPRLYVAVKLDDPSDPSKQDVDKAGTVEPERLSELVAMIEALDTENPELWKQDNTPKATALPNTTAEERAAAWLAFQGLQADNASTQTSNNSTGEE